MGSEKCLGKRKIEGWEDPYQKKKNPRSITQTSSLKYGERGEQMKPACSEWRKWWRLRLRVMEQRTEKQKKVDKNQTLIHSTDPHNRLIFIQTDEVGDSDNRRCYNWRGGCDCQLHRHKEGGSRIRWTLCSSKLASFVPRNMEIPYSRRMKMWEDTELVF